MITGTGGIAHANGSMAVAGNPCALSYNAVSTVTVSGVSAGSGTTCSSTNLDTRPDSPPLNLPIVDPTTYKPLANYWLENNGTFYEREQHPVIMEGAGLVSAWIYLLIDGAGLAAVAAEGHLKTWVEQAA